MPRTLGKSYSARPLLCDQRNSVRSDGQHLDRRHKYLFRHHGGTNAQREPAVAFRAGLDRLQFAFRVRTNWNSDSREYRQFNLHWRHSWKRRSRVLSAGPGSGRARRRRRDPAFVYHSRNRSLSSTASLLEQTFTLPANVERAFLDVYAQSQSSDEFWYACVPDDAASALESCGGTAFREAEVTIDGTPAGVAPVYPWIFTGGLDPYLWAPIPGVQTLDFVPYRVNLTPFASLLSNGSPHQVAVSVYNADNYFSATASLLLYLDHGSTQITGAMVSNNLTAAPTPNVGEHLKNKNGGSENGGTTTGTINTTSPRLFKITGYVDTSHGRVETEVNQSIHFANLQTFNIVGLLGVNPNAIDRQNISQTTSISSKVTERSGGNTFINWKKLAWPLTITISFVNNADGSFTQVTGIQQAYNRTDTRTRNGVSTFSSTLSNAVTTQDTLFISPSFEITGNQGQASSQTYTYSDTAGLCYSKSLQAANNVLTATNSGKGCNH
jgi:Peptide N-acetyl-beta-D-glucosaminyl asparaginase amidase A